MKHVARVIWIVGIVALALALPEEMPWWRQLIAIIGCGLYAAGLMLGATVKDCRATVVPSAHSGLGRRRMEMAENGDRGVTYTLGWDEAMYAAALVCEDVARSADFYRVESLQHGARGTAEKHQVRMETAQECSAAIERLKKRP